MIAPYRAWASDDNSVGADHRAARIPVYGFENKEELQMKNAIKVMAAVAAFVFAFAAYGETWSYNVINGTEAELRSGVSGAAVAPLPTGALTVLAKINEHPVTSLGEYSFYNCWEMSSATLPDSVRNIGVGAFYECSALETVGGIENVTNIGNYAFYNCKSLMSIELGGKLKTIGQQAFRNCTGLTYVEVPDSVTSIGDYAFYGCTNLVRLSLPSRFDGSLPKGMLGGCPSDVKVFYRQKLGSQTWSYTVDGSDDATIEGMMAGCGVVPAPSGVLHLPMILGTHEVRAIGSHAFYNCSSITAVSMPYSISGIGMLAFNGCTALKSVTGSDQLREIGPGAFIGCSRLEEFSFTDGLSVIGASAFTGCAGLTEIALPDSLPGRFKGKIANSAFANCSSSLVITYYGPEFTVENGSLTGVVLNGATSVTIPDSVTSISQYAFKNANGLTDVTIPASVTLIDSAAFYSCTGLKSFYVDADNAMYMSGKGLLLTKDGKTLVHGVNGPVTIPDGVTKIGESAFDGLTGLTSVTIPGSVTDIGYYAFYKCSGLKDVTIPDSVTRIEDFAFYKCTGLKTASLPGRFNGNLGSTVFSSCSPDLVITYRAGSHKVTFGKNGGTGGSDYVSAANGQAMPAATAPTLSGWTFGGYWDTLALDEKGNPKGKQYYDANMKSVRAWDKTSATTLWAKWTNKVTFGKNGGTGGDNYVTCTKGQPMPKRTMPTKTSYVFDGYWNTTGTGGVKYYNADGTSAHAWDRGGSVTLWAKWVTAASCKVTFGKNGGTGGDNYVTATTGQPMPTPRTAPTRAGWTFGGYWDTLSCDASGNPLGKQYYDASMKSVRAWDKTSAATLWAKWTVRVKLGKNGGTGGDDYATVIYNQPFPKRTMPKKPGYTFGGYFVSASRKTGQCYNPDGTGTASMKWSTGGTPTIWALWTKTSACVELPPTVARRAAAVAPSASAAPAPVALAIPTGIYSGVLADGTGAFWLVLDEAEKNAPRTAFLYVSSEDGSLTAECTAEEVDGILLLMTDGGGKYVVDIAAGIAICP